jgi:hypothetical protein
MLLVFIGCLQDKIICLLAIPMAYLEKHEHFILNNSDYFISMLGFIEFMTLDRIRKYQYICQIEKI